jgi:hypothetical protein
LETWAVLFYEEGKMESWRKVWREGLAPLLSTYSLVALARALRTDDPRLIQGATTSPPPLQCGQDWNVEAACLIGFCGWKGEGLSTVGETEAFFARLCYEVDQRMGEPANTRWLINWFDETPRAEMRAEMLTEVSRELALRSSTASATTSSP